MCCTFEHEQVYPVRAEEYDNEAYGFGAFFVGAFEVPDAVHDVAVEATGNESEKIRKFVIPVQDFVKNPEGRKCNQGVHYTDDIVFDKVFVFEKAFHKR